MLDKKNGEQPISMTDTDSADDAGVAAFTDPFPSRAPIRILMFADMYGASQALLFVHGLAAARAAGRVAVRIVGEEMLGPDGFQQADQSVRELIEAEFDVVRPTVLVLSRFGHSAAYGLIRRAAADRGVPTAFHIDDDLFDMPVAIGVERYRGARHPRRAGTLRRALNDADLVMAATPALAGRLADLADHGRIGWAENGTAGAVGLRKAKPEGAPVVVGYMGSASHGPDLEMALPALDAALARHGGGIRIELYGSIARHPMADALPGEVTRRDVTPGGYQAFKRTLAALDWDIGLAPLMTSPYNRVKTATKWVEYAEAGIATLASDHEIYRPIIEAGAAAAAQPAQWTHALDKLIAQAGLRRAIVADADRLLTARYGWERLEASVLALLRRLPPPRRRRAA